MNADLVAFVRAAHARQPIDLFVGYLSGWHVAAETIRQIGDMGIVTCGFCLDDKAGFRGRRWAAAGRGLPHWPALRPQPNIRAVIDRQI